MKLNPLSIPLLIPIEIPAGFGPNFPVSTRTGFLGYWAKNLSTRFPQSEKSCSANLYCTVTFLPTFFCVFGDDSSYHDYLIAQPVIIDGNSVFSFPSWQTSREGRQEINYIL